MAGWKSYALDAQVAQLDPARLNKLGDRLWFDYDVNKLMMAMVLMGRGSS